MSADPSSDPTAVYVWGSDSSGQLGLGKKQEKAYCYPVLCNFQIEIAEVACAEEHSLIRTVDGLLYAMGSNADGRLGINDHSLPLSRTPVFISSLSDTRILALSCGLAHSAALSSSGQLFTWGLGATGALGSGTSLSQWKPHLIPNVSDTAVVAMSCGSRHTAILTQDSTGIRKLLMCGSGESGQLGLGTRDSQLFPRQLSFSENVQEAACGVNHTLFRTVSNRVFAMGANAGGQLGTGGKRSALDPVSVAELDGQGVKQLACWTFSAAIAGPGNLYVWGTGSFGEFLTPQRLRTTADIAELAVGSGFGLVVDKRRNAYSWGTNSGGQLGLGDFVDRPSPTPIPALKGKSIQQFACGDKHIIALCDLTDSHKPPKLSPRTILPDPPVSSPRSEYQPNTKLIDQYQAELDSRRRLEVELLREQQDKSAYIKRVDAMALEIRDLKAELKRTQEDVSDREVDISRYSQKSVQMAEKSKAVADRLKEIPVLEQKVEDLILALSTSDKAKRHLEAALEAAQNKAEDLTRALTKATQELADSKEAATQMEENLHSAHKSLSASRREVEQTTSEAEDAIQNLTRRQTELETVWTKQLDEQVMKIEEQEEAIKELRRRLQNAGEMVEELQREVDKLEGKVVATNRDLADRDARIQDLQAEISRQESKNKSLVEALECELKERANSLRRAKETLQPASEQSALAFHRT